MASPLPSSTEGITSSVDSLAVQLSTLHVAKAPPPVDSAAVRPPSTSLLRNDGLSPPSLHDNDGSPTPADDLAPPLQSISLTDNEKTVKKRRSRGPAKGPRRLLLDWLTSAESTNWRAITPVEDLTDDTYHNVSWKGDDVVPAVCKLCGARCNKKAKQFVENGCSECRLGQPRATQLRQRAEVVASNKHTSPIIVADDVEQEVVDEARKHTEVLGAAKIGAMNGSVDVLLQFASMIAGVQVKMATVNDHHPNYLFSGFKASYPDWLLLVARAADTGHWLVATCGTLRDLKKARGTNRKEKAGKEGKEEKVGKVGKAEKGKTWCFNLDMPEMKPYVFPTLQAAVVKLVTLAKESTPLIRDFILRDLNEKFALETFSFGEVQRVLRQSGEVLYRNTTSSDATDAKIRSLRVQLKACADLQRGHEDVFKITVRHHTGRHDGRLHSQPYHRNDFDWLIAVGISKYQDGSREWTCRHIWYIPMSRLIEMDVVQMDDSAKPGKQMILVGVPGHTCVPYAAKSKLPHPYVEDCYNNPEPIIEALRAGTYGAVPSDQVLRDQRLLDMLLSSEGEMRG